MEIGAGHIYAFGAGLSFAFSDVLTRIASRGYRSEALVFISLLAGTPYLWILSIVAGEPRPGLLELILFLLLGPLHFGLGRLLFYKAIAGIGASSAAIATSPTVVLSSFLAWILLGESLSIADVSGAAMVSIAILIAGLRPTGTPLQGVSPLKGLAAGLSASMVFSLSSVIVRYAGSAAQAPITGAALSYTAALPIAGLMALRSGSLKGGGNGRLLAIALLSSIIVSTAQLLRYTALSLIPVVEALIFISLFPLHTLAVSAILGGHGKENVRLIHIPAAILAVSGITITLLY